MRSDFLLKPFRSPEARNARRGRREGYISLLAVTFAFGLATLGTVMAVSLRSYLRAAVGQERAILDGISLDSASAQILGSLAEGAEHQIAPWTATPVEINGRRVTLQVSLPEGKHDLGMDGSKTLAKHLEKAGLPNGLAELATDSAKGLADIARLAGLNASSEDCLRHWFTLGRAPEELEPLALAGSISRITRRIMPGDQIDVRVTIRREDWTEVLWQRARFTGSGATWKLHDDRRLRLSSDAGC